MNILEEIRKGARLRKPVREASGAARDPKTVAVARLGQAIKGSSGGDFEESPVDLNEIASAYYTDSYIRRAVDKHSALMFKNGWELSGKNDQAVEYVWTRLKLMAEGTGQDTESFLQEVADNLILFGNAYVVKARDSKGSSAAGVQATGYSSTSPVAGYFVLPSTQMQVNRDDDGTIVGYQQAADGGGEGVEFNPEDVIHFTFKKPTGRAYGVPFIFNALDDVKLLRQIEENVARLIYRNLFPLYMYKVGIDKPGFEATDEEIETLREEIRNIPVDGALVVPERHSIEVIGSQGQAIDANGYLKYFRERVFSGLGVSDTIMGISGTANKSTANNQTSDLVDSVKDFQKAFANQAKFAIINELLFEGGYDPVLNPDDEIDFIFSEIELDAKIQRENHIMQLYMQNGVTFEEMRNLLGLDTVVDESRLYINMFSSASGTEAAADSEASGNSGNNDDQPENQHGKQDAPVSTAKSEERKNKTISVSESLQLTESAELVNLSEALQVGTFSKKIEQYWDNAMQDVQIRVKSREGAETINAFTTGLTGRLMKDSVHPFIEQSFLYGYRSGLSEIGTQISQLELSDIQNAVSKHSKSFERLTKDIISSVSACYENEKPEEYITHAFTANRYRIGFISKRIAYEAYNYGIALAAERCRKEKVYVKAKPTCCKTCLTSPHEISLSAGWRDQIPPHHTNCECILTTKEVL